MHTLQTDDQGPAEANAGESESVRHTLRTLVLVVLFAAVVLAFVWFWWLFLQIRHSAAVDQAGHADAIAVFGAAEYNGRPSPVFNARLEHALELYQRGLAPVIITLGGGSGPPQQSEGGVGRDFLLAHGVPDDAIIAETNSSDTQESVARLAAIARENHLQTILAVSDGTHLFRIRQLCRAQGLHVLLSPRETGKSVDELEIARRYAHEMIAYTLWRLHL